MAGVRRRLGRARGHCLGGIPARLVMSAHSSRAAGLRGARGRHRRGRKARSANESEGKDWSGVGSLGAGRRGARAAPAEGRGRNAGGERSLESERKTATWRGMVGPSGVAGPVGRGEKRDWRRPCGRRQPEEVTPNREAPVGAKAARSGNSWSPGLSRSDVVTSLSPAPPAASINSLPEPPQQEDVRRDTLFLNGRARSRGGCGRPTRLRKIVKSGRRRSRRVLPGRRRLAGDGGNAEAAGKWAGVDAPLEGGSPYCFSYRASLGPRA